MPAGVTPGWRVRIADWLVLPYDMAAIKRVDAFFQSTNYVRTTSLLLVCLAVLTVYPDMTLVALIVARILGIIGQAALVSRLPDKVGGRGLALVSASTLAVGAPYILGCWFLWASPQAPLQITAAFALCLAMIDTVCGRRGDKVLFACDNFLIAIGCIGFPVLSYAVGRSPDEVFLVAIVATMSFGFFLHSAIDVLATRDALQTAKLRQSEQAKTEALGRLTGGVAHDFNNLLTVILGNLDLLHHTSDPAENDVLLSEARMATKRAAQVTAQLLAYSRHAPMRLERFDIVDSLHDLETLLARLLPAKVTLNARCLDATLNVTLDRGQFDAVVLNLCINARDALPDGGSILVRAMAEHVSQPVYATSAGSLPNGIYVRIEVEDNGTGMTDDVLSRVFEPYFTTKAKGHGAGMGLSMARGFAEQSGGLLDVRSVEGVGTIATLLVPAAAPDV